MEVRRFARIKKVIRDKLLDTKAEIIQSKLYFRFACIMPELSLERLTRGHNKGFRLHSLQSVNEHHNCLIQSNIPFLIQSFDKTRRKYILHTIKKAVSITLSVYYCFNNFWRRGNVYFVKIGGKPVEDGSQDICKDKENNVGPVAGY